MRIIERVASRMKVEHNYNSYLNSITYRVGTTLIDVGDECKLWEKIESVFLTHVHFDHIYGLNQLCLKHSDLLVYTNLSGKELLMAPKMNLSFYQGKPFSFLFPERLMVIEDGEEINMDNDMIAKGVFTPGHNPSCITWVIEDCLFTGDSYIPGIKTVTNLPGGNRQLSEESLNLIKQLAVGRKIYPGHLD